jgi:peptidoglycan/LPS O-acetylase OafA/YrhL
VRLRSLDGLRGYAALVVVLCHALLSSPALFLSSYVPTHLHRFSLDWWLSRPPLNLLWSGQQPVIIFFVLSGLVVVLPFIRPAPPTAAQWIGYYPRRLLRLYLPVWAAIALAVGLAAAVHRHPVAGRSFWLSFHDNPHWGGVAHDTTLVGGTDVLNGPLWTLQWEVWFSLLLPLYVVLARVARRASLIKILLMLDLVAVGVRTHHASLTYLPVFGAGAAIAGDLDQVADLAARLRGRWLISISLLLVGLALLDMPAIRLLHGPVPVADAGDSVMSAAGATLLVTLVLIAEPVRAACETRTAQWLGRQSFSLYLIHEPIVVSAVLLFGRTTDVLLVAAVSVPIALLAAWLFQLVIEGRAHDLSRRVGRAVTARAEERVGKRPAPAAH